MHRLGPGYRGQFKFAAEIDIPLSEQDKKVLYDGHLASTIMFMYSPKACDQQLCMEASPTENASYFCHSPHALMLEGVQAVQTHSFQSALNSLGGIQILLPLFTQLDFVQNEDGSDVDRTICAELLSLLSDLLKSSSTSQQQMMQCQGFLVISNILEKMQTSHLTEQSLNILLSLARHLLYTPGSGALLGNLLDHMMFNPNLWVNTPAKVQLQLFSVFATDLVTGLGCAAHMRREVGVTRLMNMLKKYYWLDRPHDVIADGAPVTPSRPNKEEVRSLRAFLLLLVKQLVLKDRGIAEEELQSILEYLVVNEEEGNILDVLQLVLSIMTEQPEVAVDAIDKVDGFRALFRFLDSSLESIRVFTLKIIGCFLQHCNPRRKVELLQNFGLFSLIGEKVMKHGLTRTTYNVLFEILVGRVSKQIVSGRHPEIDNTFVINNSSLAAVIVKMLHEQDIREKPLPTPREPPGSPLPPQENVDLKRLFLSDLVLLLNHSKENRSVILQLSCWQEWLFSLAIMEPKTKEEHRVTDTVFSLFRMLLHHAFQEEREGWRIWVDTLAILHGLVTAYNKEKSIREAAAAKRAKETKEKSDAHLIRSRKLIRTKSDSEIDESKRPDAKPDSDLDRKKFFQALLTGKSSGTKSPEPAVPNTIPEEESAANEASLSSSLTDAKSESSTGDTQELSNLNGDESSGARKDIEKPEDENNSIASRVTYKVSDENTRPISDDESRSETGVSSDIRGAEVAALIEAQKAGSLSDGGPGHPVPVATETEAGHQDAKNVENGDTAGTTANEFTEATAGESVNEKQTKKGEVELNQEETSNGKTPDFAERTTMSDEAVIDQDSSLTVTMKSSFIGSTSEPAQEAQERKASSQPVSGVSTRTQSPASTGNPSEPQSPSTSAAASPSGGAEAKASPEANAKYRAHVNIPEFLWSPMHQRLLGDLLFAIESDLQVWRSHTRKTVMDFVNAKENATYLWNLAHFVSVLADNIIYACGDLLPLLSSVTSRDYSQDVIQPCGGMSLETSFSFLNRIMSLVDVIVFTSSLSFSGVENNRSMSTGGFLRQCLRLVFCCAARNRLVCRQRNRPVFPLTKDGKVTRKSLKETREAIKALIASTEPPTDKDILQNIPGHVTTVTDPDKLLQEMDVNRLRAVVYRDFEDSRQAQFLSLTVVYFIAVMMVAKYRDLLKSDEGDPRARFNTVDTTGQTSEFNGLDASARGRAASWSVQRHLNKDADEDVFSYDEDLMSVPTLIKGTPDFSRLSLADKVEVGFKSAGSLLKEVLLDFSPFLSRVLQGSHGQELVFEGLSCQKSDSCVELVMLLCSQEWQNSLQRHGGAAFMEIVNEGRLLSHAMRERIVMTTSEAYVIMSKLESILKQKHVQFEELCDMTRAQYADEDEVDNRMLLATRRRDSTVAKRLLQKILDILTSEHGAWAPEEPLPEVQFYRLEACEDESRRRMRLVRNSHGSSHPEATLLEALDALNQPSTADSTHALNFAKITSSVVEDTYSLDEDESGSDITADENSLERDDTGHVVFSTSCHLIAPCVVAPGSLTVSSTALFFSADEDDEEYHKLDSKVLLYMDGLHGKWPIDQIKAVFSRRYLLQNCAVEVFFANGTSAMFKFPDHDSVKKVVRALPPVGVGAYYGIPQTRTSSLYSPKQLFEKSTMTSRWQKREVSTFEYLMFLNTIAGRTYCDLNQYPVFPWILTNYESDKLDLKDPKNYRDLTKPIGALNPNRHVQFLERYASWDENDDIPPFHYGTHYSTCGFTLAWLIRLEPFATQFLNLQGGKFDHPGRTFCSVQRAWQNCNRDTSDVKELIPELFYLPEMFCNSNRFTFGVDDDGMVIDDVELPSWANTPEQFVTIHRAALESEYVSSQIHGWIDLIFGFKQRGPEAVKATNVFFHLTYEGSVDLDSISDTVMREAVEQQIKSFGQTPSQLLLDPHPPRVTQEMQAQINQEPFKSIFLTFKVTENVPVTYVAAHTDQHITTPAVVTISCNQCFSVNRWLASAQSLRDVRIEQDPMLGTPSGRQRRQLGEPLDQTVTPSASCFVVTCDNRTIMACGYWDNSFKCFSTESGKLTQCVFGHSDVVTCLVYSRHQGLAGGDAIVVSGSRDATVLVWHWSERIQRVTAASNSVGGDPSPLAILTGHEQPITCVDVNAALGLVVSGSQEGPCLVHTVSGDRLYTLHGPDDCVRPRLVRLVPGGLILVNYTDDSGHLAVYTINGLMRAKRKLDDHVLSLALTRDGNFMLAGGFSRSLTVWRTYDLAFIHSYPPCDGSIRGLDISTDQKCLVAGLASGSILAIATDFSRWPIT
ncbi:neurobeachin-like isoform X3 [Nematostella vectensis]|uniref:neurobeachin-like isoform X2 n=1 Tax=Nematostella vectensis TaxID=45351 RepID=UPI0020772490|nr:neurobeachin-like isoform X2 [Nematostella vectensis]XP_048589685.1 neurobeachin-like isoform X3 [Nematostella vectensis]